MEPIKTYPFKSDTLQEFEVVRLKDFFSKHRSILTRSHRANFYHILWFQEGSANHTVDFESLTLNKNNILLLNKGVVHHFDQNGSFDGVGILFTDSFFSSMPAASRRIWESGVFNHLMINSHCTIHVDFPVFHDLIRMMREEFEQGNDELKYDILRNYLHSFLLLTERAGRIEGFKPLTKSPEHALTLQFKYLVDEHFVTRKKVSDYTSVLLTTEKKLNQATSKVLGKTPKEMINERVFLEAKRLLCFTHDTINEIGFSIGFEESTNFVKFFRKYSQMTPLAFRKKHLIVGQK